MENTVFERNYEIVEKDDHATAVFERAFAPGGFMEEFTKKMDAIPKVVVPKDKENYDYLLNRCDDYAKRHHGRIRGVVDYEHWDAHIDLYLRMLEFDDAEDMPKNKLGLEGADALDVVNLKCDPILIGSLRKEPGIFPAYHMSKANWVSVALDGSVPDEQIKMLLDMSYDATAPKMKRKAKQS